MFHVGWTSSENWRKCWCVSFSFVFTEWGLKCGLMMVGWCGFISCWVSMSRYTSTNPSFTMSIHMCVLKGGWVKMMLLACCGTCGNCPKAITNANGFWPWRRCTRLCSLFLFHCWKCGQKKEWEKFSTKVLFSQRFFCWVNLWHSTRCDVTLFVFMRTTTHMRTINQNLAMVWHPL